MCRDLRFVRSDAPADHLLFGKLVACDCNGEYQSRMQKRLTAMSGQLPSEMELTLAEVIGRGEDTRRMLARAREFVRHPSGFLTLWGTWGNGKTLLLQAIVNELRERGMTAAYLTFKDLVDWVSEGFSDSDGQGSEQQRFVYARAAQVLALDEIDEVRMTDYRAEFRTSFFDWRYRGACDGTRHTVFALNNDPKIFPGDIYDRLREFDILSNHDSSMRPVRRQQRTAERGEEIPF